VSVRDREEAVVARLHQLAPHLDGEPDPAFRTATRARLVAMAAVRTPAPEPVTGLERFLAGRAVDAAPSRWRTRLTAGLAGAALTVTAAASLVALADGARPGDVLYELKRGTEQTQLALAGDSRGETLLGFASTRLTELETLVGEGPTALPAVGSAGAGDTTVLAAGADPELVVSTLETMDDQTAEGAAWLTDRAVTSGNDAPLDGLAGWVTAQTDGLATLRPQFPGAAEDAVSRSLALLTDIAARTEGLRTALDCASGPAVGGSDGLGPVPAACVPAVPDPQVPGGSAPSRVVPGTGTGTGTGTDPQATTPAVPPAGGTGSGSTGSGRVPSVPGLPTVPTEVGRPTPSLPLPSVSLPLPGSPGAGAGAPQNGASAVPPITVCLPPLATIGDC
jgi:hypothetical protein